MILINVAIIINQIQAESGNGWKGRICVSRLRRSSAAPLPPRVTVSVWQCSLSKPDNADYAGSPSDFWPLNRDRFP